MKDKKKLTVALVVVPIALLTMYGTEYLLSNAAKQGSNASNDSSVQSTGNEQVNEVQGVSSDMGQQNSTDVQLPAQTPSSASVSAGSSQVPSVAPSTPPTSKNESNNNTIVDQDTTNDDAPVVDENEQTESSNTNLN